MRTLQRQHGVPAYYVIFRLNSKLAIHDPISMAVQRYAGTRRDRRFVASHQVMDSSLNCTLYHYVSRPSAQSSANQTVLSLTALARIDGVANPSRCSYMSR
jgi:hypothetical protein